MINNLLQNYPVDLIAFAWFILCWMGYSAFSYHKKDTPGNLAEITYGHRVKWMEALNGREDRIVDAAIIGNLMRSVTFFASTSILIVAALMPLLGYAERALQMMAVIPFVEESNVTIWGMKSILLIVIFIYAFFKYTWSLRQYNYASILVVSTPYFPNKSKISKKLARRNAKVLSNAARHFSLGIRSFYLGLAVLSWFLSAEVFIATTSYVMLVIYRREFLSKALNFLSE
jgi:uncharacterized membrane protein